MVVTSDFGSESPGSSPSSPTNLTNMEEIEKINIINKRLRQKEARADWKWVNGPKNCHSVCYRGLRIRHRKGSFSHN